jgi:hypothetical protein
MREAPSILKMDFSREGNPTSIQNVEMSGVMKAARVMWTGAGIITG